ncbi:MAG: FCD domain-containing protein [Desulfobacula sp.]|uniref:FadR/GntR family transcriptional regulator n=1 Tax=Desulfobacula sp. TaxID=2593537 RepID=UPI0025B9E2AE|nr:GntR family transcriptional regulator [Desulfobacula sp.]MCD4719579.1 FCD domain-containing protein [Desulfobacula sp.]
MSINKAIFKPVKSQRTFEEVSLKIKTLIFEGVLKSGDKLPSEADLAEQFNVGRQTVREALRILELSGFIIVKKGFGGGTIIKNNISGRIANLLLDAFRMKKISVDEFTNARLIIEKAIFNEAIDNADDQDIEILKENIKKAKDVIEKNEAATNLNFEFHSLLAKASKNNVFIFFEKAINAIHHDIRSRKDADFKTSKIAVQAHEKILDALMGKRRETAIQLLEEHILEVRKSY